MRTSITNNQFASATSAPASSISLGVEPATNSIPSTMEVRMTMSRSKKENTLFNFHGGSLLKSGKGDLFTSFWALPPVYVDRKVQFSSTGDLKRSKVWAKMVSKSEIDPALAGYLQALQGMEEGQKAGFIQLLSLQNPALGETIQAALTTNSSELKYHDIDTATVLETVFKHRNVKFKSTLNKFRDEIEAICDQFAESDEDKYSLVIRFNFKEAVNAASELKELQTYGEDGNTEPVLYPNGSIVKVQEIYVNVTYIGIVKGSTYELDTSKYVDPAAMESAISSAMNVKVENKPVYLNQAVLESRSLQVNSWMDKIEAASGNKWLKKLGYTSREGTPKFFELALNAAHGNQLAAQEYAAMKEALLQMVDKKQDLTKDRAEGVVRAAEQYVQSQVEDKILSSTPSNPSTTTSSPIVSSIPVLEDEVGEPLDANALSSILSGDWGSVFS